MSSSNEDEELDIKEPLLRHTTTGECVKKQPRPGPSSSTISESDLIRHKFNQSQSSGFRYRNNTNASMSNNKSLEKSESADDLQDPTTSKSCKLRFATVFQTIYKIFIPSTIFLKFLIAALIPAIADQIIPLFFTGQIPNESALAIAGQFMFISIILEVIQEGIVNSIFYYIGQNYKANRALALQGLKICIVIALIAGLIFTIIIILLTNQFVKFIDTPSTIIEATRTFLWTSSFSFPLTLVSAVLSNYLYITTSWLLILSQTCQVISSFIINLFLFGQQTSFPSLHWNVDQLGYYKIIQSVTNCCINCVFLFIIERMSPIYFIKDIPFLLDIKSNFKTLFKVSWGNVGDSAVRNFFYFMVTLKFINNLGETEAGAWNLLNGLIWSLLLIPSYTTANFIKVQIGHSVRSSDLKLHIKHVAKVSFISLTAWLIVLSISSALLWSKLAAYFSQSNVEVQDMSGTMFYQIGWIFIVFSYNNAMDSLFFGTGRTEYIFYQSLGTNLIVYFVPWILYLTNVLKPTLWWVLGLYISGMLVDFCFTSCFCLQLWKQIPDTSLSSNIVEELQQSEEENDDEVCNG